MNSQGLFAASPLKSGRDVPSSENLVRFLCDANVPNSLQTLIVFGIGKWPLMNHIFQLFMFMSLPMMLVGFSTIMIMHMIGKALHEANGVVIQQVVFKSDALEQVSIDDVKTPHMKDVINQSEEQSGRMKKTISLILSEKLLQGYILLFILKQYRASLITEL
ncbi:hypothetical protein V2J09_023256 [Rumex salicifolius]